MATLDYRAGSVTPLGVRPLQPDGTPPDLTGAAMQMRIPLASACLPIDGQQVEDRFDFDLSDLDLPRRLLPCALWSDWGEGWEYLTTIYLNVSGGC